jgi:translocation and assembly module TamA
MVFLCWLIFSLWGISAHADENYLQNKNTYQVEIDAPIALKTLLENHLDIIKQRSNPRLTTAEWARLSANSAAQIKDLLATEGYFSPNIDTKRTKINGINLTKFTVNTGKPTLINQVTIQFTGEITQPSDKHQASIQMLQDSWPLKAGMQFTQTNWTQAKRTLLTQLLIESYPNATIASSQATIDPEKQSANLTVEIDSANAIYFGDIQIEGLERYPDYIVHNLNPIKTGSIYSQAQLLTFQTRLQESGYFWNAEVTADTQHTQTGTDNKARAPIKVIVNENSAIKVSTGVGFSTNTGARTQLTVDHLNLFNQSWRSTTSLRLEEQLQSLSGVVYFPTTAKGYRDSVNASANHTTIEGQATTTTQAGVKRAWGTRKREQYIGASLLTEHINLDGAESSSNYAATLSYGITLRRTDNDLNPSRGYLLNAQFAGAPLASLSNGEFLQNYLKIQTYLPLTASTQLITRAEIGAVLGKNSAPAAFLFRAGGDQSVRGYDYQSLGVQEGDATVGARYLAVGSVEIVQWLTPQWGAALFVDVGNAANTFKDMKPVYGYGLGARWKSPVGPIGADIAYGQETNDYRMHFNIGVAF